MPVVRYFVFVGGALLALLLAISALTPQPVAVAESSAPTVDKTVVRIRSDPPAADASAQARVRDTFAQFVPAESKKLEPQRKRKVAKVRTNPPMRVAQQSPFGFFGSPGWNNSW
jgi:hypothetical protein